MRLKIAILTVLLILSTGCVCVQPREIAIIEGHAINARAFHSAIEEDPEVPQYIIEWVEAEAQSWEAFSDWANGRPASGH